MNISNIDINHIYREPARKAKVKSKSEILPETLNTVLDIIESEGSIKKADLFKICNLSPSAVNRSISRLEKLGSITKVSVHIGERRTIVTLTFIKPLKDQL